MSGEWYVGQQVNHFSHGRGTCHPAEVVKVGRTLVYVKVYGRETPFRMDSGQASKDFGGRIERPEDTAHREAHKAARERLSATGLLLDHRARRLTTAQLDALSDLVDEWDQTTDPTPRAAVLGDQEGEG